MVDLFFERDFFYEWVRCGTKLTNRRVFRMGVIEALVSVLK